MYERKKVNTLAKDYEQVLDIYEVDKYGNVYGNNGMELKQSYNSSGYKQVSLKLKNKRKWKKCFVHRLVAFAFVSGRTEQYNEVDHLDTNKNNNKWNNLRWTDRKGNMENPITQYNMCWMNGKEYYILEDSDLSRILKINRKQKIQSVVITDIETKQKFYFYSNREARRLFDNKVNITQAIQHNWTVRGKYKVRNLNYKKLIGMLDL